MVVGIDCSKDTLDVAYVDGNKTKFIGKFANDQKGFVKLKRSIAESDLIVMEATGPYYMQLAFFLVEQRFPVSVVNPLVIKRFCQMKLVRAKTDKKDATMIARYGQTEKPALWIPPSALILQIQQLETYLDGLKKRRTMVSNQLHSFKHTQGVTDELRKDLEDEIAAYDKRIAKKEKEIDILLEKEHKKLVKDLESIPGIGPRSSSLLTITTNGFKDFESHKQVISYYGLAPRKFESGTSVKGKSSICKMGMSGVRKVLYMAAQSAIVYNKTCKDLYRRLRAKGKPHKVAKIAVVNKLIKQAFAIAKSGLAYNEDFRLT
ncbi:MAG TPA: IS110 family transposase [Pedobacter sp.]|jgi:transposase